MRTTAAGVAFALAVMAFVFGACASSNGEEPPSPTRGLLTRIQVDDTGTVAAFTLKADDGRSWDFAFQPEPGASVPAPHLQLHIDQQLPVSVPFYGTGKARTAYRVDDG